MHKHTQTQRRIWEKERKIHRNVGSVQKSIYGMKKYEGYITVDIKDLAINLEITLEGF